MKPAPTYKARSVKIVGDDTIVLRRDRGIGAEEVQELVVIDTNTLEVLKKCQDKDELNDFLEDREWQQKMQEREARKKAQDAEPAEQADDEAEDEDESPEPGPQQPPV